MEAAALCPPQLQEERSREPSLGSPESVCGVQSGEIFVRANRDFGGLLQGTASLGGGTLRGARPFVQEVLGVGSEAAASVERHSAVQRWRDKIDRARALRREIKVRREGLREEAQWTREAIAGAAAAARAGVCVGGSSPHPCHAAQAWPEYMARFEELEQALGQHVAADVLRLYALLDAESDFIREWVAKEEAQCVALKQQVQLLYRFNLFAMQLEDETSGRVRMRRLPLEDAQRRRCVKAASENVKPSVLAGRRVDVMEVYKVENRALLDAFQRHASGLPPSLGSKIKGLFCSVPPESVERCVVFGMHSEPDVLDDSRFGLFSRPLAGSDERDAPGTARACRARSRATESPALDFPRRFSRYSTLDEAPSPQTDGSIKYLMLCRVAMGKTERKPASSGSSTATKLARFADCDALVGTLLVPDEEEYIVRYPHAVVPEFLLQYRLVAPGTSKPATAAAGSRILSVDLAKPTPALASEAFRELVTAGTWRPIRTASAFPLSLRDGPCDSVFSELRRQSELPRRERGHDGTTSADVVLANSARQKDRLRQDLDSLHSLFWVGARDAWARTFQDLEQPATAAKSFGSASRATLLLLPVDGDRRDVRR